MLAYEMKNREKEDVDVTRKSTGYENHHGGHNQERKFDNIHVKQMFTKKKEASNHTGTVQLLKENVFSMQPLQSGNADDIETGNRVGSPSGGAWNNAVNGQIVYKRDHIIDYQTLVRYAYAITFIGKDNKRAGLWIHDAIDCSVDGFRRGEYTGGGASKYSQAEIDGAHKLVENRAADENVAAEAKELINAAISWMPGNIVISPMPRGDDRHAGLDEPLLKIVDSEIKYKETYEKMKAITSYIVENAYSHNAVTLTKVQWENIAFITKNLKKILEKTKPYQYKPSDWKQDQEGKYRVRGH